MSVPKCLTEGCGRMAQTRGVCKLCYGRLHSALVKTGKATFEDLVSAGRLLPSGASRSKEFLYRRMFKVKTGD